MAAMNEFEPLCEPEKDELRMCKLCLNLGKVVFLLR